MADETHAPAIERFKEAIDAAVRTAAGKGLPDLRLMARVAAEELVRIFDTSVCLECASTAGGEANRDGGTYCRSCGENYAEVCFFVYALEGGTESLPVTTPATGGET